MKGEVRIGGPYLRPYFTRDRPEAGANLGRRFQEQTDDLIFFVTVGKQGKGERAWCKDSLS
ncbi:hypothetical protein DY000_02022233 [Brassica cretica]|uniref:Uncharacterized protein n=1 Tax=Brassica cretica TaxID=69181 RepID=A0ABQ7EGL4_BRACR|nr:hypothetical protein DY000_02022233 [Brassica cretica]